MGASLPFIQMGAMERGMSLYQLWEKETAHLTPGSEYDVVDKLAADLRLSGWFQWQDDPGEAAPDFFATPAGWCAMDSLTSIREDTICFICE